MRRSEGGGAAGAGGGGENRPAWNDDFVEAQALSLDRPAASQQQQQQRAVKTRHSLSALMSTSRSAGGAAGRKDPVLDNVGADGRVRCPHCERRFGHDQAQRHIPSCANTFAKPKTLQRRSVPAFLHPPSDEGAEVTSRQTIGGGPGTVTGGKATSLADLMARGSESGVGPIRGRGSEVLGAEEQEALFRRGRKTQPTKVDEQLRSRIKLRRKKSSNRLLTHTQAQPPAQAQAEAEPQPPRTSAAASSLQNMERQTASVIRARAELSAIANEESSPRDQGADERHSYSVPSTRLSGSAATAAGAAAVRHSFQQGSHVPVPKTPQAPAPDPLADAPPAKASTTPLGAPTAETETVTSMRTDSSNSQDLLPHVEPMTSDDLEVMNTRPSIVPQTPADLVADHNHLQQQQQQHDEETERHSAGVVSSVPLSADDNSYDMPQQSSHSLHEMPHTLHLPEDDPRAPTTRYTVDYGAGLPEQYSVHDMPGSAPLGGVPEDPRLSEPSTIYQVAVTPRPPTPPQPPASRPLRAPPQAPATASQPQLQRLQQLQQQLTAKHPLPEDVEFEVYQQARGLHLARRTSEDQVRQASDFYFGSASSGGA